MADKIRNIALLGQPVFKEGKAKVEMKPGQIVGYDGSTKDIKLSNRTVARPVAVVLENDLIGKSVQHSYNAGENIRYGIFRSGDIVAMRVKDTNAKDKSIAFGDPVKVNAGFAEKSTDGFGRSLSVSNAAGESFIKVEIA